MPAEDENKAEQASSSKISPAVLIAVVGALSGLLGGGINAYINLRTERQKSVYESQTQAQKSADDLKTEHEKAAAQMEAQRNQAKAQLDLQRFQSGAQLDVEKLKVEGELRLEQEKQDASAKLAKQEFETKLIMQAVQGVPPEVATKNLQFFLTAGFISDPDNRIAQLSVKAPPVIPAAGGSGLVLSNPKTCTELELVDSKGEAVPMTYVDIQEVAATIGVEPAVLQALIAAETRGHGFSDGRPDILFERHFFSRLTQHRFDESNPGVSAQTPGGYGVFGYHQYDRLKEAMRLDCAAALASTSWGLSQIMGGNFRGAGFATVDDLIRAQMVSERSQLDTLGKFLISSQMIEPLRMKDWTRFAQKYNGANFRENGFDTRLAAAYEKFRNVPH